MRHQGYEGQKIKLDYREAEVILSGCWESMRVLGKVAWVVGRGYGT